MVKPRCASPPGFGSPLDLDNCLIGVGIVFIIAGLLSHTGRGRRDLNSLFHWSHSVPLAVDEPA